MKRVTVILAAILMTVAAQAQTINGKSVSDLTEEYVMIHGTGKLFSNKVMISIDYGQEIKAFGKNKMTILDKNGKALALNSMVDAVNFMHDCGYEYIDAYVITTGTGMYASNVYHYTFKKISNK